MADNDLTVVAADGTTKTLRSKDTTGAGGPQSQIVNAGEHVRAFDGVQSLTLSGTSQGLTVPSGATHALIYAEGAADTDVCRYWQDGTTPTASVGKRLKDHEEIACASPSTFHAINETGTVTLRVEYYHYA